MGWDKLRAMPTKKVPVPAAPQVALKTFTPRLTPKVNDLVRGGYRYRGDLSAVLTEALTTVDLRKIHVENFMTGCRAKGSTRAEDSPSVVTSARISAELLASIGAIAKERGVSTNALVNWAVLAMLDSPN